MNHYYTKNEKTFRPYNSFNTLIDRIADAGTEACKVQQIL